MFTHTAASTDPVYSGITLPNLSVSVTDNATANAGITVSSTSGLVTTEAGGTATFRIHLDAQPTATVTIALGNSDTTEGTVSPTSLVFTPADWNLDQTITVTGLDDAVDDGQV